MNSAVRLTVLAFAGVAVLSGCTAGSPEGGSGSTSASASASASASPSTPASSSTTPSASASGDPDAPADQCPDSALAVTVQNEDAGAGSIYYRIVFTNTGAAACSLRG